MRSRRVFLVSALLGAAAVGGYFGYRQIFRRRPNFADIAYGEGERQVLDIYLPEGVGPFPFVIEIHGGAFKIGSKTMSAPSELLLSAGFAIVRPNYRLSGTNLWPAQSDDCLAAALHVLDGAYSYGLDPARCTLWGQSAGAFLAVSTALSLIERGKPPRAVISFYGPMDFSTMDADMASLGRIPVMGRTDAAESAESQLLGFAVGADPERAKAIGPIGRLEAFGKRSLPPLFVRHGDSDTLIAHGQSERLVQAWLRVDANATVDFSLVKGAGHGGGDFDANVVLTPMLEFLKEIS